MKNTLSVLFFLFAFGLTFAQEIAMAQPGESQTGILSGKVVDAKTGELLFGTTVVVDDNVQWAASTDIDGNFTIPKVPAGKHKVKVTYIGYQVKNDEIEITANDITKLYLSLTEDAVTIKEAVVTANIVKRDNESAIYVMQKNSTVIQSGISNEEMKRSPDKSSSEVIRRVSGSTIQDGKFAIIRGLADRYNMAMLNNMILPSTEPDRKAFAFDMFPSNILDNIVIMKTGQPNLPSEWAGGIIQLNTKDVPEKNFFNVTYGTGFTEGTTFNKFKTYQGSKTDFLGIDGGLRTLPSNFPGLIDLNNLKITGKTDSLHTLGKKLGNNSWKVNNNHRAYPSQSLQVAGGFAMHKKEVQFGGTFALSYSNALSYTQGTRTQYEGVGHELDNNYADDRYNTNVASALLANLGLVIKNNTKISWKNIYTINSTNSIIERNGVSYGNATEQDRTSLEFTSSRVFSSSLSGEHVIKLKKGQVEENERTTPGSDKGAIKEIHLKWNGGVVVINRDQPKTMRYSYERPYSSSTSDGFGANSNTDPYTYQFSYGGSDPKQGAMFYSNLTEKVYNGGAEIALPYKVKGQRQNIIGGGSIQYRTRNFEARNLFIDYPGGSRDSILQDRNIDNIINQQNFTNGKLTMNPFVFPTDMYRASSTTGAAYIMSENNFGDRFKAVWGFRFETFTQRLTSPATFALDIIPVENEAPIIQTKVIDTTYTKHYFSGAYRSDSSGKMKTTFPLLPSVNLIYKLNEKMNLRASYSESMSRPEFRECAPFLYYDFLRDANITGNPDLKQTFIHNADFRYEYFMGRGQAINASLFYKHFTNTIEMTSIASGSQQTFMFNNAKNAFLVGAEVEIKKNFGFISPKVEDLVFMANLAYIYSRVDLRNIKNNNSDEQVRPMQGQSPYIINMGLSYTYAKTGTGATLLYNQTGQRLYAAGQVGNPSWYENSRPIMDLQLSQKFWKNKGIIRFTISNLVAAKTIFYQNDAVGTSRSYQAGKDQVVLSQKNYRTYSLQLGFTF